MTNLFQEGIFTKEGNHFFIDESVNYLIAERKKASPTKAKHFIIAKTKEKEYYISSLYPTDIEDVYNVDIVVFDLSGKQITHITNGTSSNRLPDINSGIYLAKVTTEKGSSTVKFVVE